jgi:hypothetical protein
VRLLEPSVAELTITRTYERVDPVDGSVLIDDVLLPERSVATSFAIDTGSGWRSGCLGVSGKASRCGGGTAKGPAAELAWESSREDYLGLRVAVRRSTRRLRVRVRLWSMGDYVMGSHRWEYANGGLVQPTFERRPAGMRIEADDDGRLTLIHPSRTPDDQVSRFGAYEVEAGTWWWMADLRTPALPPPAPAPAPVVFVRDGSRSQGRKRGGIAAQLTIVRAYAKILPRAEVELVVYERRARRIFGRFVPATELPAAIAASGVERTRLRNGSALDLGAVAAARALRELGRTGRIIIMTDAQLRASFRVAPTVATLRDAPGPGVVHLVYPHMVKNIGRFDHHVPDADPENVDRIASNLGGAAYEIAAFEGDDGAWPSLDESVSWLVAPRGLQSPSLRVRGSAEDWPPLDLEDDESWLPGG